MIPASPWIGSISTAAVSSSTAAASASASPNGTDRKPGVYGPKPCRAVSSSEKLMIVVVRPWKLPCATTMLGAVITPLTSRLHLRATLMALSTASAPLFMGSTRSLPHNCASAAQNGPSRSEWKARLTSVTASSWACAVARISGLRWPKLMTAEYAARQSGSCAPPDR